ncbi:MAG: hypothetical protein JWM87_1170 [Candidatus Eremiobacteraeota bacterium]|nr:hypothetical protein [Candidatus Eremiobacteraeota bacterium]
MTDNLRVWPVRAHGRVSQDGNAHKIIVKDLRRDVDDWPPVHQEALWALNLGDGRYKVDNVPFFAKNLSFGDIVQTESTEDELPNVSSVLERSGHSTYRVIVSPDLDATKHEEYHELLKTLKHLRVIIEAGSERFFAIDVPPGVPVQAVYDVLELGVEYGIWDFEEGHFFDLH